MVDIGEHFIDVNFKFHIIEGEVVDVAFTFEVPPFLAQCFLFSSSREVYENFQFCPEEGFLSPPPPEELWVTFLIW
jgi:hypothetical protein